MKGYQIANFILAATLAGSAAAADSFGAFQAEERERQICSCEFVAAQLDEHCDSLSGIALTIAEAYVQLHYHEAAGDERKMVETMELLDDLATYEWEAFGESTLRDVLFVMTTGFPLRIAYLLPDSDAFSNDEKLLLLLAQYQRDKDYRIAGSIVDFITETKGREEAIAFCEHEIAKGEKDYQRYLIPLRVFYQCEFLKGALFEGGLDRVPTDLIPHEQLDVALTEAAEFISNDPDRTLTYCLSFGLNLEGMARPVHESLLELWEYGISVLEVYGKSYTYDLPLLRERTEDLRRLMKKTDG